MVNVPRMEVSLRTNLDVLDLSVDLAIQSHSDSVFQSHSKQTKDVLCEGDLRWIVCSGAFASRLVYELLSDY